MNGTETVRTAAGELDAFLIEARSTGGLSGSPVFVHLGLARIPEFGKPGVWANDPTGVFYWLGLVHGHYDGGLTALDEASEDVLSKQRDRVNMGIAVVVPATRVLEIFEEPAVKDFQARLAQGIVVSRTWPTESGGSPEPTRE